MSEAVDKFPDFSWDTLPLYVHIRKQDAFSDEEAKFLSTFPLITLEKTTGMGTYGCTETGSIKAAEKIKEHNPNAKVLFYRNVIINYTFYSFDGELDDHDDWILKDVNGENAKALSQGFKLYDLSQSEVREWWINKALEVCDNPAIDGLFLDGNLKVLDKHYLTRIAKIPEEKKAEVVEGWHQMMSSIHEALDAKNKLQLANIVRARLDDSGVSCLQYFDGSYLEHFESTEKKGLEMEYLEKSIAAVQKAAQSGKIIALTLGLGEPSAKADYDDMREKADDLAKLKPRIEYCVGLFLIVAEKYSYLNIHDGYDVNCDRSGKCRSKVWLKHLAEYDRPLGEPLGPAERRGENMYVRKFEHVKVKVNIKQKRAHLEWSDPSIKEDL
mmetsp:Transcript_29338/g.39160  ORF Transcript_29338/g.39160 Transcript_29338/m.39160 type:complete len:384 (-) Transcript_29338:430-1581(-)